MLPFVGFGFSLIINILMTKKCKMRNKSFVRAPGSQVTGTHPASLVQLWRVGVLNPERHRVSRLPPCSILLSITLASYVARLPTPRLVSFRMRDSSQTKLQSLSPHAKFLEERSRLAGLESVQLWSKCTDRCANNGFSPMTVWMDVEGKKISRDWTTKQ